MVVIVGGAVTMHRTETFRSSPKGPIPPHSHAPLCGNPTHYSPPPAPPIDSVAVSTLVDRHSTCVGEDENTALALSATAHGGVHSGAGGTYTTCVCAEGFQDAGSPPIWRGAVCDATGCSEVCSVM